MIKTMKFIGYLNILSALAVMILFSGCNNDEPKNESNDNLRLIAKIASADMTRVNTEGNGAEFIAGDSIIITRVGNYGYVHARYITTKGTENGVAIFEPATEKDKNIYWEREYMSFEGYSSPNAYARYWENGSGIQDIMYKFQQDQSSIENLRRSDLLLIDDSSFSYNNALEGKDININLVHALSKVTITIDEYSNFGNLDFQTEIPTDVIINTKWITSSSTENDMCYSMSGGEVEYAGNNWSTKGITPYFQQDAENGKHSYTAVVVATKYFEGEDLMSFKLLGLEYKI